MVYKEPILNLRPDPRTIRESVLPIPFFGFKKIQRQV